MIKSFLDIDFYKISMGQFVWKYFPNAIVKYEFKNRTKDIMLGNFITLDSIKECISEYQKTKITEAETEYLRGLGHFEEGYIEFLKTILLPTPDVSIENDGKLNISVAGKWSEAIYWETVILSAVNKLYCESRQESAGGKEALEKEGHRRLAEKIVMLKKYPGIRFSEFGTRRRYSLEWQEEVIKTLIKEVPEQLIGTSNVHLAMKCGIQPVGTMAHEIFVCGSRLFGDSDSNINSSHGKMLDMWYEYYGEKMSIALSDTWGSDFFFSDFEKERAGKWAGLRQDSGDPFVFATKSIDFYVSSGVNPKRKTVIFSDGLNVNKIVALYNVFQDRINVSFGWGTSLTNDLGIKPLSMVMKPLECNGLPTVKLSDNIKKATGDLETIERFKKIFEYTNTKSEELTY